MINSYVCQGGYITSAVCLSVRHSFHQTADVGTSLRIGASRLPCTSTSGPVWYRIHVDTSHSQVDEVLTVIHSLMVMDVTK